MGTFSNTFSPTGGSGASDIIPSQGSALVWLDGTIQNISGNYYFVDKKAGRNFLITGYDFSSTWTKGFPYKSAATVSAPAGYTALINADTTSFWYTSGTPNQIPVTSLFQDIDYADRTFCRHVLQATDPITHVEIAEPYVAEIVIYPTAITRSPSIISYFGIPTEQISNVHWVDPNNGNDLWDGTKTRTTGNSGPWKTLSKVDSSGTVGDTCYVKTGTLTALSTSLTKSLTYISVGHAVCKSSTSVASSIALSANIIFTGFELNGVGFTSGTNLGGSIQLLSFGGANSSVNKCIFSNTTPGTRSIYSGSYAGFLLIIVFSFKIIIKIVFIREG